MRKMFLTVYLLAGWVVFLPVTLASQEVIHALTGTISAINGSDKTITVFQDTGARAVFDEMVNHKTAIAFDKKIAAETTAATAFDKQGAYAIIFYYGDNDDRTVVAVKSLGPGPFASITGSVTKMDNHDHTITLKDESGAEHTYRIDAGSVAEGYGGVIPGLKFQAERGDQVRVVSSSESGEQVALFLRQK
ncbi:MAG: hypothetical protein WCF17_20770 [Terracidiphilus sp.]